MTRTMHKMLFAGTCILCVVFCILVYIGIQAIIQSSKLVYTTDSLFSDTYATSLQETLHNLIQQEGPAYAIKKINNLYPAIALAICSYMPSKQAHVTIESHEPLVLLNNTHVLLDKGVLISKDAFNASILKEIPQLFIDKQLLSHHSLPKHIYSLLTNLSLLCDQYIVTWYDDHALVLQDKTQNDVVFVCDTDRVPDQATLEVCHQVAQECRVTPSRKHHVVIDARFKDQLIVYGDTRGYGHGSDVG